MSVEAISPEGLRSVPGLDTPQRFYRVLHAPAPLAGMSFPDQPAWKAVAAAGFESIVCLTDDTPPYDPSPLRVLRALRFKDLVGGALPDDPPREADMLRDVVQAVVDELRAGRGVVVHCAGGTGRTGTVIACALAALGMPEADVLEYMGTVNAARRKPRGWPESDWQKSQVAVAAARSWIESGLAGQDGRFEPRGFESVVVVYRVALRGSFLASLINGVREVTSFAASEGRYRYNELIREVGRLTGRERAFWFYITCPDNSSSIVRWMQECHYEWALDEPLSHFESQPAPEGGVSYLGLLGARSRWLLLQEHHPDDEFVISFYGPAETCEELSRVLAVRTQTNP